MGNMVRSEYKEVKDHFAKWYFISYTSVAILLLISSFIWNFDMIPLLVLTVPITLFTVFLISFFGDRRCLTCTHTMTRVISPAGPVVHCCDTCKTKITLTAEYG